MSYQRVKPAIFSRKGGELSLSIPALTGLLVAVLDRGVPFRFRAKGFSMAPIIRNGDVITVSPLKGTLPRWGDVVAFIQPDTGRLVIHRVVRKRNDAYLIKGDNTLKMDGPVPRDSILGCVTGVERNGTEISLGLGPERYLIALLTRRGSILPLLAPVWRFINPLRGRSSG